MSDNQEADMYSRELEKAQKEIEELKSLINYIAPYVKENVGNEFMSNRLKEWLEKTEKIK